MKPQHKKFAGVLSIAIGVFLIFGVIPLGSDLVPIPTTQCNSLSSWQDYLNEFTTWNYKGMSGQYDSEHPASPPTGGYVLFSNPHIGGYSGSCGDGTCNLPHEPDTTNMQFYCPQDCSTALLLVGDVTATNGMKCSEYITSYKDGLLISEFYKIISGISVFKGLYAEFYNSLLWCDPTDKFMFIARPLAEDIVELYSSKLCKPVIPCSTSKDCWDRFQSCYYMCQNGECGQIQTFAPLYYPNCGGTTECSTNKECQDKYQTCHSVCSYGKCYATGLGIDTYPNCGGTTTMTIPPICTQDVKQCPDGSYVGRVAPDCQFAKCPAICLPIICTLYCEHGFQKDATGCAICKCNEVPTTNEEKCWNSGGIWMKQGVWSVDASKTPVQTEQDCMDFGGVCFGDIRPISLTWIGGCDKSRSCLHRDAPQDMCIYRSGIATTTTISTICTQDVKQCPDGSYVGRSLPNCQFAPCPVCCHSWGYGSGMVKCCHKYEWKSQDYCSQILIGGGREIVDNSFCVGATTTTSSTTSTTICTGTNCGNVVTPNQPLGFGLVAVGLILIFI